MSPEAPVWPFVPCPHKHTHTHTEGDLHAIGTCASQRLSTLPWEIFVTDSCFVCVCARGNGNVDVTRFKLSVFALPRHIYSLNTSLDLELEVKLRSLSSNLPTV